MFDENHKLYILLSESYDESLGTRSIEEEYAWQIKHFSKDQNRKFLNYRRINRTKRKRKRKME